MMICRRLQFGSILILGLLLTFGWGCSTNANGAADEAPTEEVTEDGVDAEKLADEPCGEDRWDEPPPDVTSLDD